MAKTTFSSGVIVTSQFLNGAQQIYFDGQDLDWHYPPLGLNSLVRTGPNGLDSAYASLDGNQPTLDSNGLYLSGTPISGTKVVTGIWNFGYDPLIVGNPVNIVENAPKSYTTNDKYNYADGLPTPTAEQKLAALDKADLITKEILVDIVNSGGMMFVTEIDNGIYYSDTDPACQNYSVGGGNTSVICPV